MFSEGAEKTGGGIIKWQWKSRVDQFTTMKSPRFILTGASELKKSRLFFAKTPC